LEKHPLIIPNHKNQKKKDGSIKYASVTQTLIQRRKKSLISDYNKKRFWCILKYFLLQSTTSLYVKKNTEKMDIFLY
jgi:hypothetical protein